MRPTTYTEAEACTALCIWEAMLCMRDRLPALQRAFDAHGTCSMRDEALSLAPAFERVWLAIPEDERGNQPFDWEIVPAMVAAWVGHGCNEPSHDALLAVALAANA